MRPLIYQPAQEQKYRVCWYGNKNQLHFEKWCRIATPTFDGECEWIDIDVRNITGGLPTSVKELYQEMEDYYNYGIVMEQERVYSML